jgi:hypothetical protein
VLTLLILMIHKLAASGATVDLSRQLGMLHGALELVSACPTSEPLRLSLAGVKKLLPTDIVHLLPAPGDRPRDGFS